MARTNTDLPLPALAQVVGPVLRLLVGLSVAIAAVQPRAIPAVLAALLVAVAVNEVMTSRIGVPTGLTSRVTLAGVALLLWAAIVSTWAHDTREALTHPLMYLSFLVFAVVLISWFGRLPQSDRVTFAWPIFMGWFIGLAFLLIEHVTNGKITLMASYVIHAVTGIDRLADRGYLSVIRKVVHFNRNTSALVLLMAPACLALTLARPKLSRHWFIAIVVAMIGIFAITHSQTAVAAALCGLAVFSLALARPGMTGQVLPLGFAALLLLALPLARAPYALGLQDANWLPGSFRERVLIWDWVAAQTLSRPPVGIGVMGMRYLDGTWQALVNPNRPAKVDPAKSRRAARHPHNGYLEVWADLGLPGVLLLLVFGWELLRTIRGFAPRGRPYAFAVGAAFMAIAGTGWSLWQPWLLSLLALAVVLTAWVGMIDRGDSNSKPQ